MKRWLAAVSVVAAVTAVTVPASGQAEAAPFCGIRWGSLPKIAPTMVGEPVVNVRVGQHACFDRLVVDEHRDRHEGRRAVVAAARGRGSVLTAAHEERTLGGDDLADDALARLHADLRADVVGEPQRARDHELARRVVAKQERCALTADEYGGDAEYGVEQVLSSTL